MPFSIAYTQPVFELDSFREALLAADRELPKLAGDFDAIAVRGFSGALFGGALSPALNKPLILVRKPGDHTHSCNSVEGSWELNSKGHLNWLFVDDFIDTGSTWKAVYDEIQRIVPGKHRCVGAWLYQKTFQWCSWKSRPRLLEGLE